MTVDLLTLDDRLTRLENRIKSNFFEIEKKFAELSEKESPQGEHRIQEMEDLLMLIQLENTKIKEKLGSQEALAAPDGDMSDRVARIESELGEIKSHGVTGTSAPPKMLEEISAKFDSIGAEIENMRKAYGKVSPKDVDESVSRVNAARIELENSISKFRSLKDDVEKGLEEKRGLIAKLNQAEVDVEKMSAYLTKMKMYEEKLSAVASKAESLNDSMDSKIRNESERLELIKKDIENRMASSEDKFKSRFEKLDASMESLDIKSQGINEKIGELQAIGKDLSDVASIKTGIEEQALRIASLEKNVSTAGRHIAEIKKVKDEMEEELSIRGSLEKKIDDVISDISTLRDAGLRMDEESAARVALESRLQDISSEFAGIRALKTEVDRAVYSGIEEIEKRIHANDLEKRIQAMSSSMGEQLESFDRKIELLEQAIESAKEPAANAKAEIEKAAQQKMDEFSADMEDIKGALHLEEMRNMRNEIAEHRKVIQNLKADLEIAAARFFTNNLEEFARTLDRKFPSFVSREEYARSLQEISQRLKTIEAPDLSPLASRVEMAEKKLEDVHSMMQNLAQSMPIIVE